MNMENKELVKDAIKCLELALNHLNEIDTFKKYVFVAQGDIKDTINILKREF